jgi:hypothetical protein
VACVPWVRVGVAQKRADIARSEARALAVQRGAMNPTRPFEASASRIKDFQRCPRRWAWRVIARREEPRTQALEDGTTAHAIAEAWLRDGTPPDSRTKEGRWVLESLPHLPRPRECRVEHEFHIGIGDVRFSGKIDFVHAPTSTKGDHKFVGDRRFALTAETILEDPQAMLYVVAPPMFEVTRLRWIYNEKRRRASTPVDALVSFERAWAWVQAHLVPIAREMTEWFDAFRAVGVDDPRALHEAIHAVPCNPEACQDFGRICPHSAVCRMY